MTTKEIVINLQNLASCIIVIIKDRNQERVTFWAKALHSAEDHIKEVIDYNKNQKEILEKGVKLFPHFESEIKKVNENITFAENLRNEVVEKLAFLEQIKFLQH